MATWTKINVYHLLLNSLVNISHAMCLHLLTQRTSNQTPGWEKIVLALGDRLLQLHQIHAAHVCYLVSISSFGPPSDDATRLVLLGCDHHPHQNRMLMTPESLAGFRRTEAFEWARRRGNRKTIIPSLQPFKLRYAELLADFGYEVSAREYLMSVRSCLGLGGPHSDHHRGRGGAGAPVSGGGSIASGNFPGAFILHDPKFIDSLKLLDDRICVSMGVEPSSWEHFGSDATKGGGAGFVGSIVKSVWGGGKKVTRKVEEQTLQTETDCGSIDREGELLSSHEETNFGMSQQQQQQQHHADELQEKPRATTNAGLLVESIPSEEMDDSFITAKPSFEQQPTKVEEDRMPRNSPNVLLSNPFSHNGNTATAKLGLIAGEDDNVSMEGKTSVEGQKHVDLHPPSSAPPVFSAATVEEEDKSRTPKLEDEKENKQGSPLLMTPTQKVTKKEEPKKAPVSEPAKTPSKYLHLFLAANLRIH